MPEHNHHEEGAVNLLGLRACTMCNHGGKGLHSLFNKSMTFRTNPNVDETEESGFNSEHERYYRPTSEDTCSSSPYDGYFGPTLKEMDFSSFPHQRPKYSDSSESSSDNYGPNNKTSNNQYFRIDMSSVSEEIIKGFNKDPKT